MVGVLTDLEQATPEWLTEALHQSGALPSGHVVRAEQTLVNSSSQVAHHAPCLRVLCGAANHEAERADRGYPGRGAGALLGDCPLYPGVWREPREGSTHRRGDGCLVPWVEDTVARFLREMEDRLPGERRSLYQRIGRSLPALLSAREASGRNLTLTQGDVHVGNFLYPRDSERDRLLIIDWKRAAVTIGARDLAYMMGLYWFPPTRAHRELPLLQRFHRRLAAHGVTGYTWDDLWYDYRLLIVKQVFEALWSWSIGQNSLMWWNNLDAQELL